MLRIVTVLMAAAFGGLLAYFFDPDGGRGRRAKARDRLEAYFRRNADAMERRGRYAASRAEGLGHQRQPESAALNADVCIVGDYFLPRLRAVDGHWYPPASGLLRHLVEPPNPIRQRLLASRRNRQPAVAVLYDSTERAWTVAADVDRRMRLLHRLGP